MQFGHSMITKTDTMYTAVRTLHCLLKVISMNSFEQSQLAPNKVNVHYDLFCICNLSVVKNRTAKCTVKLKQSLLCVLSLQFALSLSVLINSKFSNLFYLPSASTSMPHLQFF